MQCPKCQGAMEVVPNLISHTHRCAQCRGLWFDMGEYEHMKADAEAIDTGDKALGEACNRVDRIGCPVCPGQPDLVRMVDPQQPHIWFESCKYCYGRFYDAGEFRDYAERDFSDWLKSRRAPERV